jgi:peroxiredoxin
VKIFWACLLAAALPLVIHAQSASVLNAELMDIKAQMTNLRSLPDDQWTASVGQLAMRTKRLSASKEKTALVASLANLCTEGDAGRETLQMIGGTIIEVARSLPANQRAPLYAALARLVRYEGVTASVEDPQYRAAMAKLEAEDRKRESADLSLSDLNGRRWALKELRGKIVLLNFWATWCPPCRKEMPDMQLLHERFASKGLVVLAVSDEAADKVRLFIKEKKYTYPVLLDPGRVVGERFGVEGIPKTFVYNREGKIVAQAADRRTMRQFLEMLARAGLK